ncbi:MAG TPA: hypothetical protein DCQ31_04080 [Bacteroidales bacterium]|nr:hypothetical protein [Bacteroidales bacterium]
MFTQEMREELEEQNIKLSAIQFYVSKKIVLQRIETTTTVSNDSAVVDQTRETVIEQIIIKKKAPGICVNTFAKELEIKFEERDSCSLKFVQTEYGDKIIYRIGAQKWVNDVGSVPYDGKEFHIRPKSFFWQPESNKATLKIKRKYYNKFKISRRKVKGLKVQNAK